MAPLRRCSQGAPGKPSRWDGEEIKMHGPCGTMRSPSNWSPELLRPEKGTKRTPNPQTESELCLSVSCGGTGQQWPAAWAGALGAADLGMA